MHIPANYHFPKHASLGSTARGFCAEKNFEMAATNYIDDCFLTPFVEMCRAFLAYLELTDSAYKLKNDKAKGFNQIAQEITTKYQGEDINQIQDNKIALWAMTFEEKREGEHTYVYMQSGDEKIKIREPMTLKEIIEKSRAATQEVKGQFSCTESCPTTISEDIYTYLGCDLINPFGAKAQTARARDRAIG